MSQHQEHHDHDHNHDHNSHHHDHFSIPDKLNFNFTLAIVLNLSFCLAEVFYAIFANSMSLLADAGHNFGDVLGLLFSLLANMLLSKGASERFSYGFKRTTILAALSNALILVAGSAIIVYESIHKLIYPSVVNEMTVIVVAFIGIFINGGTALLFMKGKDSDLNVKSAFLHLAYDALISFGVVVTGVIILYTGWVRLDPIVGLLIVLGILAGTYTLLRDSINLIMDAVPQGTNQQAVLEYLKNIDGVTAVHDLHIWALSTKETALTAHLVMPTITLHDEDYERINCDLLKQFKINHVTIQVEKGTSSDPCGQVMMC